MEKLNALLKRSPFLAIGILFLLIGTGLLVVSGMTRPTAQNAEALTFEIADSAEERRQGLSNRSEVPHDGLLFVFPEYDRPGFWMKDMLFSIDIIWLRDTGEIVGIEANVSPDTYPNPYYPPEPIRYVLEVPAGTAAAKNWRVGSIVPLPNR